MIWLREVLKPDNLLFKFVSSIRPLFHTKNDEVNINEI